MRKNDRPRLVVGARGMFGRDLMARLEGESVETVGVDIEEVDIGSDASVRDTLHAYKPFLTINVAAYADVDGCEANVERAYNVNAEGPKNLALACREIGSDLIHISTDYVFDGAGDRPYRENDPENPLSVYGKSKALGDAHVREILPNNHCIIRTQWLFGAHGKNFVDTIISLAREREELTIVDDQRGSPTWTVDLADALATLCGLKARGTFHVTNSGSATWYEFGLKAIEYEGVTDVRVKPISTEQLGRPAPRPKYATLDNGKFAKLTGGAPPPWENALKRYIAGRPGV